MTRYLTRFRVWITNLSTFHHRMMMRYLVKRGWVVFYLDPRSRNCSPGPAGCWLKLWEADRREQGS